MKKTIIIIFALSLILLVLVIMIKDLFFSGGSDSKNPYEYDLSEYKVTDPEESCYTEAMQFQPPTDVLFAITTDNQNNIYVSGKEKVFVYDSLGNLKSSFSLEEDAYCLVVDTDGVIFLGMANYVEVRDASGLLSRQWDPLNSRALFTSITVNENNVFVADAGNKIVYRFDKEGNLLNTIGEKNKEKGISGFIVPSPYLDLLIGRDGELWVTNPGMHQLEAYHPDGNLISSWKRTSFHLDGFSGCCNPTHIALRSDGSFVTSEKGIERVKIHLPSGDYHCLVAGSSSFTEGTTDMDLAVDSDDRVIIMDPKRGLVRIFEEKKLND